MPSEPNNHQSNDLALQHGVWTHHERMPNGELRFRLTGPDGSSYIRTVAGPQGAWQNSHYHKRLRETYIVEAGWIVMAELDEKAERATLRRYSVGDIVTSPVLRKHNVYVARGSVIHTVKHGAGADEQDWHPAPELDILTHKISEQDLLKIA
jgi:hypothetical protein